MSKYEKRAVSEFIVTKIDHIVKHIIPFCEKYSVVGSKYFSYLDFKFVANIFKNKEHLDINGRGFEQILWIKRGTSLINKDKATNNHSDDIGKE